MVGGAILIGVVSKAYQDALAGGKHANFLRDYSRHGNRQIESAIRSFSALIERHQSWIAVSELKVRTGLPEERRADLVNKTWPKEIQGFRERIEILQAVLRERKK